MLDRRGRTTVTGVVLWEWRISIPSSQSDRGLGVLREECFLKINPVWVRRMNQKDP